MTLTKYILLFITFLVFLIIPLILLTNIFVFVNNFLSTDEDACTISDGQLGYAPWQAYINAVPLYDHNTKRCQGSIIKSNAVLTTAGCVNGFDSFMIQFGVLTNRPSLQYVNRSNIIVHPKYNSFNYDNDIAIIILNDHLRFNHLIQPVLLPRKFHAVRNLVRIIFQYTYILTIEDNPELKCQNSVVVNIISNELCSDMLQTSGLPSTTFCTYGSIPERDYSYCQGNDGGPLVTLDYISSEPYEVYILIGVLSYGQSVCSYSNPVTYTATAFYLDWIEQVTGLPVRYGI